MSFSKSKARGNRKAVCRGEIDKSAIVDNILKEKGKPSALVGSS